MLNRLALAFCLFYLCSGSLQINESAAKVLAELTLDKVPVSLKNYLISKNDK